MADWTVYCFECADEAARAELMEWFAATHPVAFPEDRYSVRGAVDVGDGTVGADYAWLDRYLYVTVGQGADDDLAFDADERWDRAAIGEFDAESETAEQVTLVLDSAAGADDEVAGGRFQGLAGMGGLDVMYALAMEHQFRFRAYAAEAPARLQAPHPDAFDAIGDMDAFVEDMRAATDIEPTAAGLEFLADDPATDDRYEYGETYGPVEDLPEATLDADDLEPLDHPADGSGSEGGGLPPTAADLRAAGVDPGDVRDAGVATAADDERPRERRGGVLGRLRRLLGL